MSKKLFLFLFWGYVVCFGFLLPIETLSTSKRLFRAIIIGVLTGCFTSLLLFLNF